MMSRRVLGYLFLAVGVVLLTFGLHATDKITERVNESLTGRYTDTTMWYIVGGVAASVAGGAMALFGGGRGARSL